MKTTKEKVSYCIGLETGKNLKQQFADIDFQCLTNGFHDAIKDSAPQLAIEEIKSILGSLKNQIETQQRQHFTKIAEDNKKHGEAFLEENKKREGVIALPSGLQYQVMSETGGTGPCPTPLDVVKINYRGSFIDGRVFDSSYQRGKPVVFPLNRVIAGWSEALQKMHVGDKWQIFIPSYLAYGEMGLGQDIAPNMTLVFEVELLAINEN